jgi:hypothetical protein
MIGNGAVSAPNVVRVPARMDEMLVLASDGVAQVLDGAERSGRYLRDDAPLARRCQRIVEAARSNGSEDDATVLRRASQARAAGDARAPRDPRDVVAAALTLRCIAWLSPAVRSDRGATIGGLR